MNKISKAINYRIWAGKFLEKHPNIHYIFFVLRRFGNHDFYNYLWVQNIYPSYFKLEHKGNLYKNKNIYLISLPSGKTTGMGTYFRYTLLALYAVDELSFTPVVEWTGESWFRENHRVNGTNNIFEYYFNQPSNVSLEEASNCFHVFSSNKTSEILYIGDADLGGAHDLFSLASYEVDEKYISKLGDICKKYIHLNSYTENYISVGFIKIFGVKYDDCDKKANRVLGIHIRGTDFKYHYDNHPNMVKPEEYKNAVDEALATGKFDSIFIATDDDNCLQWFIGKYGTQIRYYRDVYRSRGDRNIASEDQNRDNAHYLSGLETLRDIYTLAYCDGLICGLSQVSLCGRILNRSSKRNYIYEKVLSNGIYHTKSTK